MYVPPHFRNDDLGSIRAFLGAARLATLFSCGSGGPRASHVPMTFDREPEPYGTLHCHLARANEQWRDLAEGAPVLVVFMGPDAYVSPALYETKRETGKVVPTWNYVAVHAHGVAKVFEDRSALHESVSRLTDGREARREEPWHVDDAPAQFVDDQLRGIVGVTLEVTRLEAKWKMSQNRSDADVRGVIAGLAQSPLPTERETAAVMEDLLARRKPRA
ncbi:MAG: FMN-binding negative transcriptional regulator [Candidatus Eremiobacteraeota bacterium]|nr:FMN-binding negative transcriptional regulator [Candidatus Eremiobacteraeota bacterium]